MADQQQQTGKPAGAPVTTVEAPRSTALATQPAAGTGVLAWDPFALMDRLDADAFVAEMQGIASDVLVYSIKDGGKEVMGLSKGGVDECCTMLVTQGQCIREEDLTVTYLGDGQDKEAYFTVKAARFAVDATGKEVRLDQVLGVKREPLYEQRAALTLDSRVPGKKWKRLSFREALEDEQARDYLVWLAEDSSFDEDTKTFVRAVLDGVDVQEFSMGKRFNNFWYEHGAMKAARNARFRLIPAGVKAQVMAVARESKRVQEVDRSNAARTASADTSRGDPRDEHQPRSTRTTSQPEQPAAAAVNFTNGKAMLYPYGPLRQKGATLDAVYNQGATRVRKGEGNAPDETVDVSGAYVVADARLDEARAWCSKKLKAHDEVSREGKTDDKAFLKDADYEKIALWIEDLDAELERRSIIAEGQQRSDQPTTSSSASASPPASSTEPAASPTASNSTDATPSATPQSADATGAASTTKASRRGKASNNRSETDSE